jgi:LAO/AO transport system kinase
MAFVRPSPSSGTLGGVTRRTRETIVVCEAAGFDVVLVETVGVGQSETVVSEMTDFFLVLMLPGAGDELQGIKRGLLEVADLIAVNKADGENAIAARRACAEYAAAVRCIARLDASWTPPVVTCSARTGEGVAELWQTIEDRLASMRGSGSLGTKRLGQSLAWMRQMIDDGLRSAFVACPVVAQQRAEIERAVARGDTPAAVGAAMLVTAFMRTRDGDANGDSVEGGGAG